MKRLMRATRFCGQARRGGCASGSKGPRSEKNHETNISFNSLAGWLDLKKQQDVRAAPVKANKLTVGLVPISYFPFGLVNFLEHPNPNIKTRLQPSVRFVLSTVRATVQVHLVQIDPAVRTSTRVSRRPESNQPRLARTASRRKVLGCIIGYS